MNTYARGDDQQSSTRFSAASRAPLPVVGLALLGYEVLPHSTTATAREFESNLHTSVQNAVALIQGSLSAGNETLYESRREPHGNDSGRAGRSVNTEIVLQQLRAALTANMEQMLENRTTCILETLLANQNMGISDTRSRTEATSPTNSHTDAMGCIRQMKAEWLPAFETFAVTVELEKDNYICLKVLAMTLAFAEVCICAKKWLRQNQYTDLQASLPRAKGVSPFIF